MTSIVNTLFEFKPNACFYNLCFDVEALYTISFLSLIIFFLSYNPFISLNSN